MFVFPSQCKTAPTRRGGYQSTLRARDGTRAEFICRGVLVWFALDRAMLEGAMALAVAGDGLAFAEEFIFVGGESFKAHRAARVQFARADAQFRAQPVPETVGESCGSILKNASRI